MSAITHMEARRRVLAMVPNCPGWTRYEDVAQSGHDPPWIVLKFVQDELLVTEALAVTTKLATLEIRVVGDTADGIGVICDKMCDALQGAWPGPPFGRIRLDVDSGVYASELVSTKTNLPFLMRVLRFRVSWAAC